MKYSINFLKNIEESKRIITEMILNAKAQSAKNYDMLNVLQDALQELSVSVDNDQKINREFIQKWNSIMGWVPRVFEDHPLLDLIKNIDKVIVNDNL